MLPLIPLVISLAPEIGKWLFGSTGEKVASAVGAVVQAATGTSDAAVQQQVINSNPQVAADLRAKLAEIAAKAESDARQSDLDTLKTMLQSDSTQVDLDKTETANTSVFVAGWRPFIGWICGVGLGWSFCFSPLLGGLLGHAMPVVDTGNLMILAQVLLGVAGMRSWEKLKGVVAGH